MQCPSCHRELKVCEKFCQFCGAELPTPRQCDQCGTELTPDTDRCPDCFPAGGIHNEGGIIVAGGSVVGGNLIKGSGLRPAPSGGGGIRNRRGVIKAGGDVVGGDKHEVTT